MCDAGPKYVTEGVGMNLDEKGVPSDVANERRGGVFCLSQNREPSTRDMRPKKAPALSLRTEHTRFLCKKNTLGTRELDKNGVEMPGSRHKSS